MRNHGRTIEAQWRAQTHSYAPTRKSTHRRTSLLGNFLNYLWSLVWIR